jgi:hypothetical protein
MKRFLIFILACLSFSQVSAGRIPSADSPCSTHSAVAPGPHTATQLSSPADSELISPLADQNPEADLDESADSGSSSHSDAKRVRKDKQGEIASGPTPNKKHGTNSLIFGIIGLVTMPLGLVFSILAIVQAQKSKRHNEKERRLGKVGKILGIIGIILFPFALISTIFVIYLSIILL